MARIRTIKPEFWKHEDLSELPEATHMLAAALLNYADDEGYFNANVALIKAECSPLREPSVSIQDSLTHLSNVGYIRLGEASNGKRYGQVLKFSEHQRVNRPTPSKIAALEVVWEGSSTTHTQFTEDSPPERKGKEGKGSEGSAPTLAYSKSPPPDWIPDEILPGQARPASGIDLDLELMNFRAHTFNSAKPESAWQGEWIKWINRAKPNSGPANKPSTGIEAPPRTKDNVWTSP